LGSTLARVLTLAPLLVVFAETRETEAGRRSNPRGATAVTARGVAAVTVVIIVADRSIDRSVVRWRAPRSSASPRASVGTDGVTWRCYGYWWR